MPPMPVRKMKYYEEEIDKKDEPLVETLDFKNPTFTFIPKETHEWRQKGYFLECKSCDLTHGLYIGPDKIMVGLDEKGQPLLKKRY